MKLFKIMALSATMGAATLATPALAQDDDAFVTFQVLKPEVAQTAAIAAMESCREAGYQVGVMVVDRFGIRRSTYATASPGYTSSRPHGARPGPPSRFAPTRCPWAN